MSKLLDLLKSAGGEAQLASRLGQWRLAASILTDAAAAGVEALTTAVTALTSDVSTLETDVNTLETDVNTLEATVSVLSGGGMLPATGTTQGARPLDGYDTTLLEDGSTVFVEGGINEWYYFSVASALVADGLNVVDGVGPGQFLRSDSVIVQADWYVDSVAGSDENPGTAGAPLQTLGELTRRTESRVLLSSISLFTVTLLGTFPTEPLSLNFSVSSFCWIQITAPVQTDYSGSITGFTTYSAGVTAALLDDAAAAFVAGDVSKRVRLTSGAGSGAIAVVLKAISGTQIRVSDFYTRGANGYNAPVITATPANGVTYDIESLTCQVGGYDIVIDGGVSAVIIDGVEFIRSSANLLRSTGRGWCAALPNSFKLFGCKINATGANFGVTNSVGTFASTVVSGTAAFVLSDCSMGCYGLVLMTSMAINQQGSLSGVSLFQQLLTTSPVITVLRNGSLNLSGNWAAYDLTGDAALAVEENAAASHTAATTYWGIGAATSYGIRTRTAGIMIYVTKPTISGSVNDTIVGGTATAYGAIPFINPANNAAIVLRA